METLYHLIYWIADNPVYYRFFRWQFSLSVLLFISVYILIAYHIYKKRGKSERVYPISFNIILSKQLFTISIFLLGLTISFFGLTLLVPPYMFAHFIGGFSIIFGFQIIFYLFDSTEEIQEDDNNLPTLPHSAQRR
jgi:hypothetical protein